MERQAQKNAIYDTGRILQRLWGARLTRNCGRTEESPPVDDGHLSRHQSPTAVRGRTVIRLYFFSFRYRVALLHPKARAVAETL